MKGLIKNSERIKELIQQDDLDRLSEHTTLFYEMMINNLGNQTDQQFSKEEIEALELCAILFEHEHLHLGKYPQLCYLIKQLCGENKDLTTLSERMDFLQIHLGIYEIAKDWKPAIDRLLEEYIRLEKGSSLVLSDHGRHVFLNRCTVSVLQTIKVGLDQINITQELPMYLMEKMEQNVKSQKDIPVILSFLAQQNDPKLVDRQIFHEHFLN